MPQETQRIVLRPQVTPDDVQDIAWDLDWNAVEVGNRTSDTPVDVWATRDERTEIRLVEDRPIGMRYFLVRGPEREAVSTSIRNACPTWTPSDAVDFARRSADVDDILVGVYAVALSAESEDRAPAIEQLRALAAHPDAAVRQAVVIATGYVGWPELVAVVEEIHRDDPVDHVRTNAGVLLDGLRRGR